MEPRKSRQDLSAKRMYPDGQLEMEFGGGSPQQGYDQWMERRRATRRALADRVGLPVDHLVEIWLRGGIRLRGRLRWQEERVWAGEGERGMNLVVDGVMFAVGEMESCVRTDA